MKTKENKGWGGKRSGSGRKRRPKSKTMRVPIDYELIINELVEKLDDKVKAEPSYLESIKNKKQQVNFEIAPLSEPNA